MSPKLASVFIFIPVILFVGFITSQEDFKVRRIRNKWILIGLVYVAILYFFSFLIYIYSKNPETKYIWGDIAYYLIRNFDKWFVNLTVSIIVAYVLWHFRMWGAGDAKLFICYAALIPIGQYSKVYFNYYFASFSLLFYIFLPATIFLSLKAFFCFFKNITSGEILTKIRKFFKEKIIGIQKYSFLKSLIGFFVLFYFTKILREKLDNLVAKSMLNQNLIFLVSLLVYPKLNKFFRKRFVFVMIATNFLIIYTFANISYYINDFFLLVKSTILKSGLIMIFFPLVKKITDLYTERTINETMPFAPWMFLGALLTWFL